MIVVPIRDLVQAKPKKHMFRIIKNFGIFGKAGILMFKCERCSARVEIPSEIMQEILTDSDTSLRAKEASGPWLVCRG